MPWVGSQRATAGLCQRGSLDGNHRRRGHQAVNSVTSPTSVTLHSLDDSVAMTLSTFPVRGDTGRVLHPCVELGMQQRDRVLAVDAR